MFILSFVLEDWAIHELLHSLRHRRQAVILVASSYVTWTYQSHTFSNSIETLLVAWSLVLIERIVREKVGFGTCFPILTMTKYLQNRSSVLSCGILSFIIVFGVFNRITFPAFILIPGLQLLPHFLSRYGELIDIASALLINVERPASFFTMIASAFTSICVAIATDTAFYRVPESTTSFTTLYKALQAGPVITPWNNILYNTQTSNLALHGLHPQHQHFLANLPQLLGPGLILLVTSLQPLSIRNLRLALSNPRFLSAVSGTAFLSIFPHQEPRFLLPCVPLLLTCVRLPNSIRGRKWFWTSWLVFNILLGTLMGIYHQGGVIPAQLQIPRQIQSLTTTTPGTPLSATIFWWKTYPPPTYLLGNTTPQISTIAIMGLSQQEMLSKLSFALPYTCHSTTNNNNSAKPTQNNQMVFLIAPLSSHFFPPTSLSSALAPKPSFITTIPPPSINNEAPASLQRQEEPGGDLLELTLQWTYSKHINLDDMDIAGDGLWPTLVRVVGRRGIGIWSVRKREGGGFCQANQQI